MAGVCLQRVKWVFFEGGGCSDSIQYINKNMYIIYIVSDITQGKFKIAAPYSIYCVYKLCVIMECCYYVTVIYLEGYFMPL